MSSWNDTWLPFLFDCSTDLSVSNGVEILNPYVSTEVRDLCRQFYKKYYGDDRRRNVLLGINPGRLGAGVTGISFTDPEKLESQCGLKNSLEKKEELSSRFIYQWINRMSTPLKFYRDHIILAVCPLGFITGGKNINYYDDKLLQKQVEPLIIQQQDLLRDNCAIGSTVYMLGKGKNYRFFERLNETHKWYEKVVPLPHPRWVMQYRYTTRYEIMDQMALKLIDD